MDKLTLNQQQEYTLLDHCMYQATNEVNTFSKGDKLVIIGSDNTPFTQHEIVTALTDASEGYLADQPHIKVIGQDGTTLSCRAKRFISLSKAEKLLKVLE